MQLPLLVFPCPLELPEADWQVLWPPAEASSPTPAIARTPTSAPMIQPRTVRNLVSSACSACLKPFLPGAAGER